ncbi:MAG: SUMF1/EgtB/PvdO family nonheme iron enzyme [Blastocatellia bacterium]|nr:SUMF1/EgtB/PvdO family nonheme iron enzyme [Blastocatellia bacterium]
MRICPECKHEWDERFDFCPTDGQALRSNIILSNKYALEQLIGKGGMGLVYRARHQMLKVPLAVKVLHPKLVSDPHFRNRFLREACIAAKLKHDNIIHVLDCDDINGIVYFVMEYLVGQSLRQALLSQPFFSLPEVSKIAQQICSAVYTAHLQGVLHCDLKPANIFLEKYTSVGERVKVLDFGLARLMSLQTKPASERNLISGTPEYMSPEQINNDDIDVRADVYSMGVLLFELLTGKLPFQGTTPLATLYQHLNDVPPDPRTIRPDLPEAVCRVVLRAMDKERHNRQQTMLELANDLEVSISQAPPPLVSLLDAPSPSVTAAKYQTKLLNAVKTGVFPVASPPAPKQKYRSLITSGSHNLGETWRTYEFESVTMDPRGKIVTRKRRRAKSFVEGLGNGVALEMVEIPSGTFLMGMPEEIAQEIQAGTGRREIEISVSTNWIRCGTPQNWVNLPKFFIGKHEITQAQWEAVMGTNPSMFKDEDLPVEHVSWLDAVEFCRRLSEQTGRCYELPTEAEWEYACRTGTSSMFALGEMVLPDSGTGTTTESNPKSVINDTAPVGSLGLANAFGLYDLHGNVWEWCQDGWHETYHGLPLDGTPWLEGGDQTKKVVRGGSWTMNGHVCRTALRNGLRPSVKILSLGFRVKLIPTHNM